MRAKGQGGLTSASRRIVIAGAGIAGLTAAIALARRHFDIALIEKAPRLEEAGAGVQLSPNASRILTTLGLDDLLAECAFAPDDIRVMSMRSGKEIMRMPLGSEFRARHGAPYRILHRADLQSALLKRLPDFPQIELRLGTAFEGVAAEGTHVNVSCRTDDEKHTTLEAIALIGADGVWSRVRESFDTQATFSGHTAWRGTIDVDHLPSTFPRSSVSVWLHSGAHLVAYPMRGGRLVNLVAIVTDRAMRPGWNKPGDAGEIAMRFRRCSPHALAIIEAVASWTKWPLFKIDNPAFAHGRIALIGDASHAMMPFAAQGAAMAIEDAAILTTSLSDSIDDPVFAFRHYESLRRARIARVQQITTQSGAIFHLPEPLATARNLTMKLLGGSRLMARRDWLYGWRGDDPDSAVQ